VSESGKKKVVRVESTPKGRAAKSAEDDGPVWAPTPEAKAQATKFRIISWILWIVAIAVEVATIIWVLPQSNERFWFLLVMLIPIAILAIVANLLWKKANRLDPASKKNKVKFFVQNQLGAFMTVLAFLPLIIFVLFDKNLDGKQKAIAGGLAAVLMVGVALATGTEFDGGPSQEQYAEEENIMQRLTGKDEVFWVKNGKVFHVCEHVPDVNRASQDGQIYVGTVAEAHAAGKERLSLRWPSDAVNHCGYTQADVDAVQEGLTLESDSDEGAEIESDTDTDQGEPETEQDSETEAS